MLLAIPTKSDLQGRERHFPEPADLSRQGLGQSVSRSSWISRLVAEAGASAAHRGEGAANPEFRGQLTSPLHQLVLQYAASTSQIIEGEDTIPRLPGFLGEEKKRVRTQAGLINAIKASA